MVKPRDPNAPKRNMTAYLLYQNAMRETFRKQNPGMTFGQLSKYTSAMYAAMQPEEKQHWNERAEADKARYLHELQNYVAPPGFDSKGDAHAGAHAHASTGPRRKGGRSERTKTTRDPNAPKKNMSAYLLYQNCYRETFKSMNPGITFGQLAKYTSHMYKALTVEEKQKWEAHAAQDKARYEAEMQSYSPPAGYDAQGNLVEDRRLNKKYTKKSKDPEYPKRARASFVFFTKDERPKVMEEFPGIKFVDMGVVLGERWRALSAVDKVKYEEAAHEDKQRFNKEMEDWNAKRGWMEEKDPENAQIKHDPNNAVQDYAVAPQVPYEEDYDHAAAAAAHAQYYADPNAAYYAEQSTADPYGHAVYYGNQQDQSGSQTYHYA